MDEYDAELYESEISRLVDELTMARRAIASGNHELLVAIDEIANLRRHLRDVRRRWIDISNRHVARIGSLESIVQDLQAQQRRMLDTPASPGVD